MRRITYLQSSAQCTIVLADVGMGAAALTLPQDALTAAVRLGGILARGYGKRLPGEYWAEVASEDAAAAPVRVYEDDPWVLLARDLLADIGQSRNYTAEEFAAVRQALIETAAAGIRRQGG